MMIKNIVLYSQIICLLFVTSCNTKTKPYQHIKGNALGTTFSIIYDNSHDYSRSIDSLFGVVNRSLSTYHPNSIISRINRGDSSVVIDAHFRIVFTKAKRIYKETDGLFDPTVGPLVSAYGFGPEKALTKPDSVSISKLMPLIGFNKVTIKGTVIDKLSPKIFLDFNAIAKGYAIDVIGIFFESKHISNYMIEVGGEVRARGVNSKQQLWKIGIEKPLTDGTRALETSIRLHNQSMATSGNYRKFRIDANGKKYVHTINPKTGETAQNDLLSATVISTLDCADVDAYATSFMVMGYKNTRHFLELHPELQVFLIYLDKSGNTQTYSSF